MKALCKIEKVLLWIVLVMFPIWLIIQVLHKVIKL